MGATSPTGRWRQCELRHAAAPDPSREKGGSLPSTSDFPVRHGEAGNMVVTA